MLVPWWQRLWGSSSWYHASLVDWNFRNVSRFFRDQEFKLELVWLLHLLKSRILRVEVTSGISSKKDLFLDSSFVVSTEPPWILLSSSVDGDKRWREWWSGSRCSGVCLSWHVCHRDEPVIIHQSSWRCSAAGGDSLVAHFDWSWWSGSKSPIFYEVDRSKESDPPSI